MGRERKNGIILIPNNPFAIKPTLPLTGQIVLFLFSYIRPSLLSSPYLYIYASYMCNLLSYIRASYMCNSLLLYTHSTTYHHLSYIYNIYILYTHLSYIEHPFSLLYPQYPISSYMCTVPPSLSIPSNIHLLSFISIHHTHTISSLI